MPSRGVSVERRVFRSRAERAEYVAQRYGRMLRGNVLDVGCDQAVLRRLLPGRDYTGVDVGGDPDIRLDLETLERLPFPDNAFDCVVCTDVLEHLDNLHVMFAELLRVTRQHVLLSLPNCWFGARVPVQRGRGSFGHYGLPLERPADRHKWFFSLSEALQFVEGHAPRLHYRIGEVHAMEKPRPWVVRALRRLRYPNLLHYLNRYAHTAWFHLEKLPPGGGDPVTAPAGARSESGKQM